MTERVVAYGALRLPRDRWWRVIPIVITTNGSESLRKSRASIDALEIIVATTARHDAVADVGELLSQRLDRSPGGSRIHSHIRISVPEPASASSCNGRIRSPRTSVPSA